MNIINHVNWMFDNHTYLAVIGTILITVVIMTTLYSYVQIEKEHIQIRNETKE